MLILSPGFRILYANPAAREMLGQTDRPPPEGRIFEWIRSPELEEILSSRGESDEPAEREIQLFGDQGERVLLATVMSFLRPGSERNEHLLILRDITESRRLEQMRREFVANVSHELRTPLTSIRGYVETLLAGGLEDEKHNVRFVEKIKSQAARLELLVNELLDLSRIETARQKLELQEMDCSDIVQDVVREFNEDLASAGLTWKVDVPSHPVRIRGDRKAVSRALSNLVDNAVKYSQQGDEIRVSVYGEGDRGCITVEDTGPGIPDEEKARIFERFYRGSSSRGTGVSGSGLGLSIVKHLVQALGGQLSVDTQLGRGSRFTISFPLSMQSMQGRHQD
jgi:two-component system phosphate regulon sensor histidine kinase PhoR